MRWLAAVAVLAFLAVPPAHSATDAQPVAAPAADCALDEPPCGYIAATVNLEMEGKKPCRKDDRSDCLPVPILGEAKVFQGKFEYYWKLSEDGTYPPDPTNDIEVTFQPVASNHKWLTISVEPSTFSITAVDLVDPNRLSVEENNVVYYRYERDITVTITHDGEPTQDELDRVADKDGVANVMLKVRTGANEPYYKEGFGTEDFRFDASSMLATTVVDGVPQPIRDDQGRALPSGAAPKAAPAGGLLAVLAGLGAALVLRRRA